MKAVDLFGGEQAIRDRMLKLMREHIATSTVRNLTLLEDSLYLERGTFVKQLEKKSADVELFKKVGSPLGVSVFTVFGKPEWCDESTKKYWEGEMKEKPIAPAAFCNGGQGQVDMPLDMYVTFCALNELQP